MTKVQQSPIHNGQSLAEFTNELFQRLPTVSDNEKDYRVFGNLITIVFDSNEGAFPISVNVTFEDTPTSVHERFVAQLKDHYEYLNDVARYEFENYEHASVTQGRAFDSLTC